MKLAALTKIMSEFMERVYKAFTVSRSGLEPVDAGQIAWQPTVHVPGAFSGACLGIKLHPSFARWGVAFCETPSLIALPARLS